MRTILGLIIRVAIIAAFFIPIPANAQTAGQVGGTAVACNNITNTRKVFEIIRKHGNKGYLQYARLPFAQTGCTLGTHVFQARLVKRLDQFSFTAADNPRPFMIQIWLAQNPTRPEATFVTWVIKKATET
jgi:hypothetical protein